MYQKTIWLDQDVERPKTYEFIKNEDGTYTLLDSFGEVTELGTAVCAQYLNNMENGIETLDVSKANVSFSNLAPSAKELICQYGCPDYSAVIEIAFNSQKEFIAPSAGFISLSISGSNGGEEVKVNSNLIYKTISSTGSFTGCTFFKVDKNDIIYVNVPSRLIIKKFFPLKGAN